MGASWVGRTGAIVAAVIAVGAVPAGAARAGDAVVGGTLEAITATAEDLLAGTVTAPGRLAVQLAPGSDRAALLGAVAGITDGVQRFFADADGELARWYALTVPAGTEAIVRSRLVGVAAAVTDLPVRLPAGSPNDPRFSEQWHLARTGATSAWGVTRGNPAIRIAVIDTVFQSDHPDLRANITDLAGRTGTVERYTSGCPTSMHFGDHGTQVAGIAAATTDNRTGVAGVGFSSRVVGMQVGVPIDGMCAVGPEWVTALHDAAVAGVPVVSLSFAGPGWNALEAATIRDATARGTLVVAAAGNAGSTEPHYPAAYPDVIAVASLDGSDRLRPTSNRGSWVDVGAPGEALLTTCRPSTYCRMSGTSVATPVVAGAAALTLARWGDLAGDGQRLRHRVLDAAARVTGKFSDPAIGAGRVDIGRAVRNRVVRLWGADRVATASELTRDAVPGTADTVVLVPADAAGDTGWRSTLPAAGLLADGDTALVLTTSAGLHPAARAEIERLQPSTVTIAGSEISTAIEDQLAASYEVTRLAGVDAADTAAVIADAVVAASGATTALIARGDDPADALSLAAPAADRGLPLLYVGSDHVPAATCDWIGRHVELETVVLAGGPNAIAPAVEDQLVACQAVLSASLRPLSVERDAGATRVGTSLAVARRWFGEARNAIVANGWRWPDAVTGGALAAAYDAPILLTGRDDLAGEVSDHLRGRLGPSSAVFVLGGPAVIAPRVEARLESR